MDKPIIDKISQKADEFAQREYMSDSYERDALSKGYYWGYKEAEKGIISLIESRIEEILGDAQPAPVLRAELREMIDKIKEK